MMNRLVYILESFALAEDHDDRYMEQITAFSRLLKDVRKTKSKLFTKEILELIYQLEEALIQIASLDGSNKLFKDKQFIENTAWKPIHLLANQILGFLRREG